MFAHLKKVNQLDIQRNLNLLTDALNKAKILNHLVLNNAGLCTGLTYGYQFYTNERIKYVLILMYFAKLRKIEIDRLVQEYQKNPEYKIDIGNQLVYFKEIIEILEKICSLHADQSLQQLSVVWHKTYTFICDQEKLTQHLIDLKMQEGESSFMRMGKHIFLIEKKEAGYYFFEANRISKKALEWVYLNDEAAVVKQLLKIVSVLVNNNLVAFTMQIISNQKNIFDDIILKFNDMLTGNTNIESYIGQYKGKQISALDCALSICTILQEKQSEQLLQFQGEIENYIKSEKDFIDLQFKQDDVKQTAYPWKASLPLLAARYNQINFLKKLLQAKDIDVNEQNLGYKIFHFAIDYNYVEIAKLMLDHPNIEINLCNDEGCTSLYQAAQKGNENITRLLLNHPKIDINCACKDGATPLYIATQFGNATIVNLLLEKKASLDTEIKAMVSVLMQHAIKNGRQTKFELLLKNKNAGQFPATLTGFTPLHAAIFFGHTEIVKALQQAGANVNKQTAGISCLELAEVMGDKNIAALFQPAPETQYTRRLS